MFCAFFNFFELTCDIDHRPFQNHNERKSLLSNERYIYHVYIKFGKNLLIQIKDFLEKAE